MKPSSERTISVSNDRSFVDLRQCSLVPFHVEREFEQAAATSALGGRLKAFHVERKSSCHDNRV
jgi:hypothetical protein